MSAALDAWLPARAAAAILAAAGLVLVAAGCGGSSSPGVAAVAPASSRTAGSAQDRALTYARCMRSHGVPSFPDPGPQGDFPPFRAGVPKTASNAADDACRHLLSSGGTATPQQRVEKLAFGLRVARCMRSHGFPGLPDPTGLGENRLPPGIDPSSPQFQRQETICEQQSRRALGLG